MLAGRSIVLVAAAATAVGCISSEHFFPEATLDASGLWAKCSLPAVAPVHRASLAEEDAGDQDTCAVTRSPWTASECEVITIQLDDTGKCATNDCCQLRHESEHVSQFHATCTLCAHDPDGRAFDDCMSCYAEGCEPEREAAAYHVECAILSACGPGGDGRDGSGPSPDAALDIASDVDGVCFAEWDACTKVLAAGRALPASCGGKRPACEHIVDLAHVTCGCGTAADRAFGCALACPDGGRCVETSRSTCSCL